MPTSLRSQTSSDSPWHSRDWEAHLLAGLLRSSRITVLYGEAGAGKTALLRDAVLPLLRRRTSDTPSAPAATTSSGVVIPFPERRQRQRDVEVVAYFSHWEAAPLPALLAQLAATLGIDAPPAGLRLIEVLSMWQQQRGTRLLLLLDQFEVCLAAQAERSEVAEFVVQLTEVVNHATVSSNVLISLRSDAEPGLDRLRHRIPGFDRHWLRLPHWQRGARPALSLPEAESTPANAQADFSSSGHGFMRVELTAESELPSLAQPAVVAEPAAPGAPSVLRWLGLAMVTASVTLLAWAWFASRSTPAPMAARGAPIIVAATPAPDRLARDLASLAPPPSSSSNAHHWPEGFTPLSDQPTLAIARYDALQAARTVLAPGALNIVAPLFAEQIHLIVRADSPLQDWQQIEGKRIAVDARNGADALTLRSVYAALFGTAPDDSQLQQLPPDAAVKALLDKRSIDAIALVAADPSDWLAGLGPTTRLALKLLPFDPQRPGSQRAMQRYVPITPPGGTATALSVMAFIVTTDSTATTLQLRGFVQSLCQRLPALRRDGHPAWRGVDPTEQLKVGWPDAPAASEGWRNCRS